jgi:hypothetical protein
MHMADGEVFSILDLNSGTAKTYRAKKVFLPDGEMLDSIAPMATSHAAGSTIANFNNAIADAESYYIRVNLDLPDTSTVENIDSATRFITNPQLKEQVAAYLQRNATLLKKFEIIASSLIKVFFGAEFDVKMTILLDDGSKASFKVTLNSESALETVEVTYIEGSAEFASGGKIPTDAQKLLGNYLFNSESDSAGFGRLGALWGINIGESSSCREDGEGVSCRVISDGKLECTYTKKCP